MHTPDALLALHRRLLAGDRTAGDTLFITLHGTLQRKLTGRDLDNKSDAVTDAIVDLVEHPQKFDPAKSPLEPFLLRAARFNLINLRVADRRRRVRETKAACLQKNNFELPAEARNLIKESVSAQDAAHRRLLAAVDPADWPVAELQRIGERRTAKYAAALGLGDLPVLKQRQAVKRAKDRVSKTASRLKG